MEISYTSRLASEHLRGLQELMFFNERQQEFRSAIIASIEQYGEPQLKSDAGFIRIHTDRLGQVQALFALEEEADDTRPIGVAIYARTAEDTLTLLHIGVASDFASDGPQAGHLVVMNLLRRLVHAGRQIKGVKKLVVLYGPDRNAEMPIRR